VDRRGETRKKKKTESSRSNAMNACLFIRQLLSVGGVTGYESLPSQCPLLPSHDMYSEQEGMYHYARHNLVMCDYCGKQFKSLFYVDRHMDLRHRDKLVTGAGCLADWCDVLGCPKVEGVTDVQPRKCSSGNDDAMPRHQCHTLVHRCFPPDSDIYNAMSTYFCDQITCGEDGRLVSPALSSALRETLAGTRSTVRTVITATCVLFLFLFYAVMLVVRKSVTAQKDLRDFSNRSRHFSLRRRSRKQD
jgi:hypothetical protein